MTSSGSSPTDDLTSARELAGGRADVEHALAGEAAREADLVESLLPSTDDTPPELAAYVGRAVVLDTRGPLCYIGSLDRVTPNYYILSEADVCDVPTARTTKEKYVMEAAKYGVKQNRRKVVVVRAEVVSLSALEDIIAY